MRLPACLSTVLLAVLITHTAYSQNATVSLDRNNVPISTILEDIEHQTDYLFVYQKDVDVTTKKDIHVKSAGVETVLNQVFTGTNIG